MTGERGHYLREDISALEQLARTLIGRTITDVGVSDASGRDAWGEHENIGLTLDDGRHVVFGAWGFDSYGVTLTIELKP